MVRRRVLDPAPVLDESFLLQSLRDAGIKDVHSKAIWAYALKAGKKDGHNADFDGFEGSSFQASTPAHLTPLLNEKFGVLTSEVVETQMSEDGTVKLLVRLQDGKMVESVIIKHGGKYPRNTLCVSSQVGCQMACTFCATGTMGLIGDLWAGEILEQVLHAIRVAPIRNIVFMGMGEPLNNYDAVLAAIRGMSDGRLFGLSPRHITLSTVGVVPRMRQLTRDAPETQLALSLHAPNQTLRNEIVPSARAYRLDKLIEALDGHLRGPDVVDVGGNSGWVKGKEKAFNKTPLAVSSKASPEVLGSEKLSRDSQVDDGEGENSRDGGEEVGKGNDGGKADDSESVEGALGEEMIGGRGAGRRALIEYVMLAGVNDSRECGQELGALLKGRNVLVNLIPYNPTFATGTAEFKEPTEEALQAFREVVAKYGLLVTIRRHHGRDIDGACGQLALKTTSDCGSGGEKGDNASKGAAVGDIEDVVPGGGGKRGVAKSRGVAGASRRGRGSMAPSEGTPGSKLTNGTPAGCDSNRDSGTDGSKNPILPIWPVLAVSAVAILGLGTVALILFSRTKGRGGARSS